jgi:hypothetical protein
MTPDEDMNFACAACGHRAASEQDCPACGDGVLLDYRRPEVLEILRDSEMRLNQHHEDRLRWLAVALGVGIGIGINFVPGFRWPIRLPFFGHWWIFTIATTFFISKGLDTLLARTQRFPYITKEPDFDKESL